jgi:membrane-associated phospholipid phosphatase
LFFGLSRVFGGIHYPFDVLAGAVLGCTSAWFIHKQSMTLDPLLDLIVRLANRVGLA